MESIVDYYIDQHELTGDDQRPMNNSRRLQKKKKNI